MNQVEQFYALIQNEMAVTLATAAQGSVTMRTVSPVGFAGGILIFTHADSVKYRQLRENPGCCIGAGLFFAEATAEFLGATMLDENAKLREVYAAKFPGAFDEGVPLGGRAAEFILLRPFCLKGWAFPDDLPTPDGIPTVPFTVQLRNI